MCEHVLTDKPTAGGACDTDRFYCFVIRVQKTGEHLLSDKSASSGVCGNSRLLCSINRV